MNRAQRRQSDSLTRQLRALIAEHGIEVMLAKMFGPDSWRYDAREQLWIVPDTQDTGSSSTYYCMRANGDWFKARLDAEHTQ